MATTRDTTIKMSDFARYPVGIDEADGPNNAQQFRRDFLVPALTSAVETRGKVTVRLDGVASLTASFLDAAFGGLVSLEGFSADTVMARLNVVAEGPLAQRHLHAIWRYVKRATPTGGELVLS